MEPISSMPEFCVECGRALGRWYTPHEICNGNPEATDILARAFGIVRAVACEGCGLEHAEMRRRGQTRSELFTSMPSEKLRAVMQKMRDAAASD
jgi:predicted outer membrane lipoprotein